MQIVIDIPVEDYTNIEPFLNGETIKGGFNLFKTLEIIKNGIPLDKHDEEIIATTVESIWGKPPYTELLDKIRAEIDRQQKWLLHAGYTAYNVDIALDAIKSAVAESEDKE